MQTTSKKTGGFSDKKEPKKPNYRQFGRYKGNPVVKVGENWYRWDAENQRHIPH